ncbi:MAG: T9SS type A sorting domain-containing protein [Candidatus Cloacimonetes bacterium]|nr:T9SS type A sorting domain-containing protein [Candidatus Cloacimonadota bacterium]MBL7085843.1 T9SS type A sorting domain-containing protein [Candidatus Cloacimonadota bacterium]
MKKIFIIITSLAVLSTAILTAEEQTFSFSFEPPEIQLNQIKTELKSKTTTPGEPVIPFYTAKILLPYGGEIIDIIVTHSEWIIVEKDVYIEFAQTPHTINSDPVSPTKKNDKIYSSATPYPAFEYENVRTDIMAGHSIAIINIFPIRYLPKSEILEYAANWELNVITEFDSKLADYQSKMLCNSNSIYKRLSNFVENQEEISSYYGKEKNTYFRDDIIDPDDPHDYIIITSSNFVSTFETFKDWKNDNGLNSAIFTTEDIYENYTGEDNAAKIRNFILVAYSMWSSSDYPLEYVLLGGDDEIVPLRYFYVNAGGTIGNIPSDLYFSALDGDWNADGDDLYGEMQDEPDFIPEVSIGRIPGDIEINFINAINKIIDYSDNPKPALEKACMVGENLNWNPVTWGGDYKDDILSRIPEENYHFYTLYQRDGTYSSQAVANMINDGVGIMNHMGHANYWILMGISPSTADQFINDEYGLIYTQGCLPAAFDEPTSHSGEAVAERLIIAENGPMAFIGNTRYGWYMPGSLEGPSQQFDRTFFDGLFEQDIKKLGDCNNYSKTALIDYVDNPWMRWCYYELILFGDPECEIIVLDGEFPYLEPSQILFNDDLGDGDGIVNPGEDIILIIHLENLPDWQPAYDVTVTMQYEGNEISIIDSVSEFGDIFPGGISTNIDDPIIFHVSDDCGCNDLHYKLYVTANSQSAYPFEKTYYRSIDISLMQNNWPVYLGCEIKCSPIIVDLDNDDEKEMIVVDRLGNIYSIESDASISDGFPIELNKEVWASLAVGDINNDDEYEIVIVTQDGNIYALDKNGAIIFEYQSEEQMICTPCLADLNDDQNLEIIAPSLDGKLYVVISGGDNYPNFPYNIGATICSDAAVGDIDGDGIKDIICGTADGLLYAFSESGSVLNGFPVETGAQICSSPIIFDNNIAFSSYNNKIYVINGFGEIQYIKDISSNIFSSMISFSYADDLYALVYNTLSGTLDILDEDGFAFQGWPQEMCAASKNSPTAVDINGDGEIEILSSTTNGNIFCYTLAGELLAEFPIISNYTINSPLAIEDFDGDGDFEIISGSISSIIVWDYKVQKGISPWPMYRGNIQRTGNYSDNIITAVGQDLDFCNGFVLYQNYPNPFSYSTIISFHLATKSHENTQIKIYNIKGQLIKTLPMTNDQCPMTKIVWDGKDEKGNYVSNGIYLYKLSTEKYTSQVRKLLLIR